MNDVVDLMRQQKQTGGRSKIYKEVSTELKGGLLADDLERKVTALRETIRQNRVNWDDLEDVQRRCLKYLEACKQAQSIPTVSGLAVFALGVSRQGLNSFLRAHSNTATAQFLQQMKDIFADTLETAALNNNINSIMAIFVMKNDYDRADRVQVEPVTQTNPLGELQDPEELRRRILGNVVVDDEDF